MQVWRQTGHSIFTTINETQKSRKLANIPLRGVFQEKFFISPISGSDFSPPICSSWDCLFSSPSSSLVCGAWATTPAVDEEAIEAPLFSSDSAIVGRTPWRLALLCLKSNGFHTNRTKETEEGNAQLFPNKQKQITRWENDFVSGEESGKVGRTENDNNVVHWNKTSTVSLASFEK